MKILICDDSLLVREKLKETLNEIGAFDVYEAANGEKALEAYREVYPDLVLMDIVMPEMDGLEALKKIKDFDKQAKIVILSSSGTHSHLKKAIDAGAIDFIQKPWDKSSILAAIEKASGRGGQ